MSEQHCGLQGEAPGNQEESRLSPRRAFIVQFRGEMDAAQIPFTGRVEHILSGWAMRFHTPKELLAFFTQVLNITRAKPP